MDRGLGWMILASALAHAGVIAVLLVMPVSFTHHPPLLSYTVDLVAPDKLGGTNLVAGNKGKVEAPPKVEPAKVQPPPPPPAPPHEEPPPREEAKAPVPPPPPAEKPKPPEPPKSDNGAEQMAMAQPTPAPSSTATTKPQPTVEVVKAEPTVTAKPQQVAKVAPSATASVVAQRVAKVAATPTASSKPQQVAKGGATPTPSAKPQQLAKGGGTPGKTVTPGASHAATPGPSPATGEGPQTAESKVAHERDAKIAAALKRIQAQEGARGGGAGSDSAGTGAGGPLSVGPGEGAGGQVRGVEFIMYKSRVETMIKQKWAWAGTGRKLHAVVAFRISDTGEITDVRTIESSGDATYDVLAERAVKAANPLPPPPADYRQDFANYELTFEPQEDRQP